MPTARELLEQADALMRRNRASRRRRHSGPDRCGSLRAGGEIALRAAAAPGRSPDASGASDGSGDVPVLTEAVEEIEAEAIDAAVDEGEPSGVARFRGSRAFGDRRRAGFDRHRSAGGTAAPGARRRRSRNSTSSTTNSPPPSPRRRPKRNRCCRRRRHAGPGNRGWHRAAAAPPQWESPVIAGGAAALLHGVELGAGAIGCRRRLP